MDKDLDQRN